MKQRVYFPEKTKATVIAEGYNNVHTAQTAVDAFLQDVTYHEEPESGFHYSRRRRSTQTSSSRAAKYVFTIHTY